MQNRGGWLSEYEQCDSRCSRRRNHYAAAGLLCGHQYLGKCRPCVHHRPERPFGSEGQRRYQPGGVCRYAEDHRFQGRRCHRRAGNRQRARPDVGRPAAEGLGLSEERRKLAEYDGAERKNGVQCHRGAASHPEHEVSHRDEHDLWWYGDADCQCEGHWRCNLPVVQGGGRQRDSRWQRDNKQSI